MDRGDVEFVMVARMSDLHSFRGKLVKVENEEIVLWQVDGKVYAMNNVCPHQHFSMLHQGVVDGAYVTCPMHGWTFSLEDGRPKTGNGRAKTYRVKVKGADVFVERPKSAW